MVILSIINPVILNHCTKDTKTEIRLRSKIQIHTLALQIPKTCLNLFVEISDDGNDNKCMDNIVLVLKPNYVNKHMYIFYSNLGLDAMGLMVGLK